MRRLPVAILILCLIIALSFLNAWQIERVTAEMKRELAVSMLGASDENAEMCADGFEKLKQTFLDKKTYFYSVMRHDELDAIQQILTEMAYSLQTKRYDTFCEQGTLLSLQIDDVKEMEDFNAANIF